MAPKRKRGQLTVLLCKYYLERRCQNRNCPRLHFCKDFLISDKKCFKHHCKYEFSHDPLDEHNIKIMAKLDVDHYSRQRLVETLRQSFPRICKFYWENDGLCEKENCNRIHICHDFSNSQCNDQYCSKSHNIKDNHNSQVLKFFSLHKIKRGYRSHDAYLWSNILISENIQKRERASTSDSRKKRPSFQMQRSWKSEVNLDSGPTEQDVIYNMLDQGNTSISLESLNYFDNDQKAEEWLVKHQDAFRLESTGNTKTVHICVEEIRPCPHYLITGNSFCSEAFCGMFHVCYDFLFHEKHNKRTCKFNHDLQDSHNQMVLSNLQFTRLTETHIMELLRVRYPFVCMDYNYDGCFLTERMCTKLHICYDYLNGSCQKVESLCRFKHESALNSQQALEIMKNYHIEPEEFEFCVILPERKHKINKMLHSNSDDFNPWKDEAICLRYLAGECEDSSLCHLIHSPGKRPFLWQNKKANEDGWENFSSELNEKMEKEFCDPSRDSWSSDLAISCESFATLSDIKCNKYNDENVEIRRLSTKSSVKGQKDDYGLTEWQWYWKGNTEWHKYEISIEEIELAFLNGESSWQFQTTQFNYILLFDTMKQQNQDPRYHTERAVRRRPVFKIKEDMKRLQPIFITPLHWPLNHSEGERISLDESHKYQELKNDFEKTMSALVCDIQEVCNKEHYHIYKRKKITMWKKLGDVNEKFLYHGTDHSVVDAICAQNFDWRLCGKNKTSYGKGSYFSTNASYSHRYTTMDSQGYRYMFLASILAGRSTVGHSGFVRPPQINASTHDLYDSCVNNIQNPSIYVIFERNQCYPRYLIKYKETAHVTDMDRYNTQYTTVITPPKPYVSNLPQSGNQSAAMSSTYATQNPSYSYLPNHHRNTSLYGTQPTSSSTAIESSGMNNPVRTNNNLDQRFIPPHLRQRNIQNHGNRFSGIQPT